MATAEAVVAYWDWRRNAKTTPQLDSVVSPMGMATANPTVGAPQGQGYNTRSIIFLPHPNDDQISSYIEIRNP
jgi:hypothetical protein